MLLGYKYRKRLPRKEKKALSKKVKRETLNDLLKIEADVIEHIIEIVGYMNRRIGANIHSKIMRNFKELYNIKKRGMYYDRNRFRKTNGEPCTKTNQRQR